MQLNELFDTKVEANIEADDTDELRVSTVIGDRKIVFYAYYDVLDSDYANALAWLISFHEEDKNSSKALYNLTGSGNAGSVFGFIRDCLLLLIKKRNPKLMIFEAAKKENRAKVYSRMLKKLNLSGYTFKTYDESSSSESITFVIEKK